jgi:hypothetical protein
LARSTAAAAGDSFAADSWAEFARGVFYVPGDITKSDSFGGLDEKLGEIESGAACDRVYYLSTAPRFYEPAILALGEHRMADESRGTRPSIPFLLSHLIPYCVAKRLLRTDKRQFCGLLVERTLDEPGLRRR